MAHSQIPQLFKRSLKELINILQAANNLVPCSVIVALFLGVLVIAVSLISVNFMIGVAIVLVVVVSIIIFAQTNNYGEAALALVAGLLTAFTVDWTIGKFIAFTIAWLGFSLFALIISSIKLASQQEEIYLDAAQALGSGRIKEVAKQLKEIATDESVKVLGPIGKAKVLRLFAYRKMPISAMQSGLRAAEVLSILTRVDHEKLAIFVADIHKMFGEQPGIRYRLFLNKLYEIIRESPASPTEFIYAFQDSRRLVLSNQIAPDDYFQQLKDALEDGIPADEVYEHLCEKIHRANNSLPM